MLEELKLLHKLQKTDDEIRELCAREEEIPGRIDSIEEELARRAGQVEGEEQLLEGAKKRRRMLEVELETSSETIKKYERQLLEVTSKREYDALRKEMEGEREKASNLEDDILTLMDEIDEQTEKVATSREELARERSSSEEKKQALETELNHLRGELAVKEDERKRITVRLSKGLLERYRRIGERWGGLAVTTIETDVCGGCHTTLPPQFINEVKKGDRVLACEHCGRILIWNPE